MKDNLITQLANNEIVIIEHKHTGQHWGVVKRTWYGSAVYGWVNPNKKRCLYHRSVVSSIADVLESAKVMLNYKDDLTANGVIKVVDFKTLSNG